MPAYSIVIPTYNSSKTLRTLLQSLAEQSFNGFEVIVVDDGSTDDTHEIASRFDIRYERQENRGPAAARNRGAALASGEWLVFADADTVFRRDTMEQIDRVLKSCDADALVGTYSGQPANKGFVPEYKALWERVTIDEGFTLDERGLARNNSWAPRPGVVRKSVFNALGGFNTAFRGADLEDMELGYRLFEAGYKTYFAPAVRIQHHYPHTMAKELRPFARRVVLWIRMRRRFKNMDSSGEGGPRQALAHLAGFASFWALPLVALGPVFAAAPAAGLLVYAVLISPFLGAALREKGLIFTIRALLYCWMHTITLGFSALYGLLTPRRGV
ncbi:MAG: glycosyltransferase family 2 protein [Candidatus Hydrogenedentota bacterium]